MAFVNHWNNLRELLDDVENERVFVKLRKGQISTETKLNEAGYTNPSTFIYNIYERYVRCINPLENNNKNWNQFCKTIGVCDSKCYESCIYPTAVLCNICLIPVTLACIPALLATYCCAKCYNCVSAYACLCTDYRKYVITETSPFDFHDLMVYEELACKYCTAPDKLGFVTQFDTNFGNVVLKYDNEYDWKNKEDISYITEVLVDDVSYYNKEPMDRQIMTV